MSTTWLPVYNATDETIPPFAVVVPTGVQTDTGAFAVAKCEADGEPRALVCDRNSIPPGATGVATADNAVIAAYSTEDDAPAAGDTWGPAADEWVLRKDKAGYQAQPGAGSGVGNFVKVAPAGLPGVYQDGGYESPATAMTLLGDPVDVPAGSKVLCIATPYVNATVSGGSVGFPADVPMFFAIGFAFWDAADPTPANPDLQTPGGYGQYFYRLTGQTLELQSGYSAIAAFTVGTGGTQRIGLFYKTLSGSGASFSIQARQIIVIPVDVLTPLS